MKNERKRDKYNCKTEHLCFSVTLSLRQIVKWTQSVDSRLWKLRHRQFARVVHFS